MELAGITPNPSTNASSGNEIAKATQQVLGKDDFLKLLMTQLRFQDALDPVKDKDFIAQMAQFSSLEQTTNLADSFAKFASRAGNNEALAMLGRQVTAIDPDTGATLEGKVSTIDYKDGDPQLTLDVGNGKISVVKLTQITSVTERSAPVE